jgi:imidazolonepropionase-like amidohydrolase
VNGARALGVNDRLGSVDAGKLADLVVVRGNPLEDIRNTRNVSLVVNNGTLYDPDGLKGPLKGRLGPAGPEERPLW